MSKNVGKRDTKGALRWTVLTFIVWFPIILWSQDDPRRLPKLLVVGTLLTAGYTVLLWRLSLSNGSRSSHSSFVGSGAIVGLLGSVIWTVAAFEWYKLITVGVLAVTCLFNAWVKRRRQA